MAPRGFFFSIGVARGCGVWQTCVVWGELLAEQTTRTGPAVGGFARSDFARSDRA